MTHLATGLTLLIAATCLAAQPPAKAKAAAEPDRPAEQKVIHDAAEYNAYMTALNLQDPAAKGVALESFMEKYPGSVVRMDAMEQAMAVYQQAGNQAKVEEKARGILALQPSHTRALAILAFITRAKATAGDKEALQALPPLAQAGLGSVEAWRKLDGTTDVEFGKMKDQMRCIFHGAAGFVALQAKDYAKAREHLGRAVAIDGTNMQDLFQLGIAELEMNPLDTNGFWHAARAMQLAGTNTAGRQSIEAYAKAKYKKFHGGIEGWDPIVHAAADQATLPTGFSKSVKRAPTPAEIAVQAVQEYDPATLSFSDYEYILSYRDASPANKIAAGKVWATLMAKQKGGKAKLKLLGLEVVSAAHGKALLAITEESVKSKTADLEVTLKDPKAPLPAAGDLVNVTGLITSYVPKPFRFIMKDGELSK